MKQVTVTVAENTYDLTQHLCNYVKALKGALADGWQPGEDVPVLVQTTLVEGLAVMKNVPQLGNEKDENVEAFVKALALGATDIGFAAVK